MPPVVRRPLRSRNTRWAALAAERLKRLGATPNQISLASIVFAALGGAALALGPTTAPMERIALLIVAAGCIQLRLLCNLLDGMVAVEGGLRTRSGELFNDLPDRVSDALILVGAGYSLTWPAWGDQLGWSAALLAVMTAYVRLLGASMGAGQQFCGPMAKPHRMALLTAACLLGGFEAALGMEGRVMALALALIVVGCVVTVIRRVRRILRAVEAG